MKIYQKTILTVLFLCVCFGANRIQAQDLQQQLDDAYADLALKMLDMTGKKKTAKK